MSDQEKPVIELHIPVEITDNKGKSSSPAGHASEGNAALAQEPSVVQEMPSITSLLQRKKLSVVPKAQPAKPAPEAVAPVAAPVAVTPQAVAVAMAAPVAAPAPAPAAAAPAPVPSPAAPVAAAPAPTPVEHTMVSAMAGGPPPFRGQLVLEKLDLKGLLKMLSKHKKSSSMKKLDCLGYLATRFEFMAYFDTGEPGKLIGLLGFGTEALVTGIPSREVSAALLPGIFESLVQGESYCGPASGLKSEDRPGLQALGFPTSECVGVFPVKHKKVQLGVWICTATQVSQIPEKELKDLKKAFSDLALL